MRWWPAAALSLAIGLTAGAWSVVATGADVAGASEGNDSPPRSRRVAPNEPDPSEQEKHRKEYRVKAALLFNFLKYTTFPKSAFKDRSSPIVLMVVGKDPFGDLLESTFDKKELHGRTIKIIRRKRLPKDFEAHLIFAGDLRHEEIDDFIEATRGKPCLTVGEKKGFAEAGGFINIYEEKGKIRFEINADRQKDTGLDIKAELLKLAKVVETKRKKRSAGLPGEDQ